MDAQHSQQESEPKKWVHRSDHLRLYAFTEQDYAELNAGHPIKIIFYASDEFHSVTRYFPIASDEAQSWLKEKLAVGWRLRCMVDLDNLMQAWMVRRSEDGVMEEDL